MKSSDVFTGKDLSHVVKRVQFIKHSGLSNSKKNESVLQKYLGLLILSVFIVVLTLVVGMYFIHIYVGDLPKTTLVLAEGTAKKYSFGLQNIEQPYSIEDVDFSNCEDDIIAGGVIDLTTGQWLWQKDINTPYPIGSITKLMTALVAYKNFDLNDNVYYKTGRDYWGSSINMSYNEYLSVHDALYALLVYSANDIAYVLADNYPDGYTSFVAEMNSTAQLLGMAQTQFDNPVGLDSRYNHSSVADLSKLINVVVKYKFLKNILETKSYTVHVYSDQDNREVEITNRNQLLLDDIVDGGKTGYTIDAGQCLISYKNINGHIIVFIVLNSVDRFEDTKCLISAMQ